MTHLAAPRSAPGWFCSIFAGLTILRQLIALVDTQPVCDEFNISEDNSVRVMGKLQSKIASPAGQNVVNDMHIYLPDNWSHLCADQCLTTAYFSVIISVYDLIGALEDNWTIYWFSLLSRLVEAALFFALQGGWENIARIQVYGAIMLAACMWWSRPTNSGNKKLAKAT